MTVKVALIFVGALVITSCGPSGNQPASSADATGIYVREYAIEISNPETGNKIGMRQVRDSIFIEPSDNGYQVSNRKWRMNDYDQEGWVSMTHSEDRSFPTFLASYDEISTALLPQNVNHTNPIFLDLDSDKLFKDRARRIGYRKVD